MTTPTRGRRSGRPSGDDRQRAIALTLERLLQQRPLADITIDDLAAGAAISRPTFYFYFPSKQAVLLELLDRMVDEIDARLVELPAIGTDSTTWWRSAIGVFVDVFGAHRAATLALAETRASPGELRDVWARRSARWIHETAVSIAAEQRRGTARADIDPQRTSIALNLMNERVITAALGGETPSIPVDEVLDTLTDIWCCTIYGSGDR